MTEIRYFEIDPRRFRLTRANEVVETKLIGCWKRVPVTEGEFVRGDPTVGLKLRLKDGREVALDQLILEWGDAAVGTPDYDS
ncbi:hypothetical protein IU501_27085 [Nocardia otitidiscaviarum]|uniref:hypothetical protein n=1 Tax=Nocardia otitidiscaviarum TaxID=1823 RepID=UPI0004A72E44|nr:hypothetical protein [Nocardia otitidiscaviarum]MBF6136645.1 hypothetical protein [Nocardia otitidiscaviarum]MBF6484848.1 hypothetical protein [Nocardia otitidiscaviarum]